MKLTSKYFDSIRVKPGESRLQEDRHPTCNWRDCDRSGEHKAPRGRAQEGEYYHFCVNHVRQYNKQYNYFSGMSDEEFIDFQKSAATGHRPTWDIGQNTEDGETADASARVRGKAYSLGRGNDDPHGIFEEKTSSKTKRKPAKARPVRNMERKSLEVMNLNAGASKDEISARFKELVKRHHPDINPGDKGSEDKLREVIQAHNYLRKAGLV